MRRDSLIFYTMCTVRSSPPPATVQRTGRRFVKDGFSIHFVGAITDRPHCAAALFAGAPNAYLFTICADKNLFWTDADAPNHVHLLLQIHSDSNGRSMIAPTILTVVRLMKETVSEQAGFAIWQKGFYDHVIRNDMDYQEIWNYIEGNPGKWTEDRLYTHS